MYTFRYSNHNLVQFNENLFGCLKKKTKSGQADKAHTASQSWTLQNFQFLEAHIAIWMETRELGRVLVPMLPADLEEEEEGRDEDDATSRISSPPPSTQLPSTSQASPSQPPSDRRPKAPSSSSGKRVDEAILKLANHLSQNTA